MKRGIPWPKYASKRCFGKIFSTSLNEKKKIYAYIYTEGKNREQLIVKTKEFKQGNLTIADHLGRDKICP